LHLNSLSLYTHKISVPNFGGPSSPKMLEPKISARFRTTSRLDRKYLRNATRHRQSENGVANYGQSRTGKFKSVYFGPQTATNRTGVLTHAPGGLGICVQCESKKSPPEIFWHFFPNGYEFFVQSLHACYMFLPTLDYKFLFNYLQLGRSYAILSATTQFTSYVQNVHHRPKRALAFSAIFPKQLGILVQILHVYYTFLCTLDYKFLFNYLQL